MKRLLIILTFLSVVWVAPASTRYYIPHIAESAVWETYAILDNNANEDPARFVIRLLNDGEIVETLEYDLLPLESVTVSLREYGGIAGYVWTNSNLARVRIGYVAREDTGGGTAEFDAPDQLLDNPVLSLSDYTDVLTWSGFALWNYSSSVREVSPRIMLRNGTEVNPTPFTIQPYEKKVNYFESEFGYPFEEIASVTFFADDATLCGILISGMENERLLFTGARPYSTGWTYSPISGGNHHTEVGGQVLIQDYKLLSAFNSYWSVMDYGGATIIETNVRSGVGIRMHSLSGYTRIHKIMQAGDRVFVVGRMENRYFASELDTSTLNPEWTLILDEVPTTGEVEQNPLLRKITGAVTPGGGMMMVCLTDINYDLKRYLIQTYSGNIFASKTTSTEHLLGDVFYYNDEFYFFRTDRSGDSNTPYTKVNLYHHPTDSMTGGGSVHTLPSTDPGTWAYSDGTYRSVYQSGTYIEDGVLYTTFQYCPIYRATEETYPGGFSGAWPAMLVLASMDLSDITTFTNLVNTFIPCQFGARTSIVQEPGGGVAAFVSDWRTPNLNTKVVPFLWPSGYSTYGMYDQIANIPGTCVDPIFLDEDIVFTSFSYKFGSGNNNGVSAEASFLYQFGRRPYGQYLQYGPVPPGNW